MPNMKLYNALVIFDAMNCCWQGFIIPVPRYLIHFIVMGLFHSWDLSS